MEKPGYLFMDPLLGCFGMARLVITTEGQRQLLFPFPLAGRVQMHENCLTSQMQINKKKFKERSWCYFFFFPLHIKYVWYVSETTDKLLSCTLQDFTPAG